MLAYAAWVARALRECVATVFLHSADDLQVYLSVAALLQLCCSSVAALLQCCCTRRMTCGWMTLQMLRCSEVSLAERRVMLLLKLVNHPSPLVSAGVCVCGGGGGGQVGGQNLIALLVRKYGR
jgi:hypothetical protein